MNALSLPFRVLDLQLEARADDVIELPEFAGSVLRGAYGAALRRITCLTGAPRCLGCPLRQTCPYPELFEPPPVDLRTIGVARDVENGTPPYVILPPLSGRLTLQPGDPLKFSIRLFGNACGRVAFVVEAWREALARGLGRTRGRSTLAGAWAINVRTGSRLAVYGTGIGEVPDLEPILEEAPELAPQDDDQVISLLTPLRLLSQGRVLREQDLTPRIFIASVIRRTRSLAAQCGTAAAQSALRDWPVEDWLRLSDGVISEGRLSWHDWRRYSARQGQGMVLGGLVGSMRWSRVDPPLASLLRLACLTHVGKESVFGFGRISIGA